MVVREETKGASAKTLFVCFKVEVSNFLFVLWVSSSRILAIFHAKLLAFLLLN